MLAEKGADIADFISYILIALAAVITVLAVITIVSAAGAAALDIIIFDHTLAGIGAAMAAEIMLYAQNIVSMIVAAQGCAVLGCITKLLSAGLRVIHSITAENTHNINESAVSNWQEVSVVTV